MRLILAGVMALGLTGAAQETQAPAQADFCRVQSDAITAAVKDMGYNTAANIVARDAVRQSLRQGEIANLRAAIQNRLTVMNGRGCEPYSGPMSERAYAQAAMICIDAERYGVARPGGREVSKDVACDRSLWKADPDEV